MSAGPLPARLADATTREIAAALAAGPVAALLPVGSTEAHGPHLPLATDVILAETTALHAQRVLAERRRAAVVLPPLAYAVTEFVREFRGTLSVRAATVAALVEDVAAALFAQGFGPLCLVNGHLEPEHARMLKDCAASITAKGSGVALFPDQRRPPTVGRLGEEFGRGGGHAGGYETSLVLAARPDLVREDVRASLATNFQDIAARLRSGCTTATEAGGPDAYFGDPAAASAAEGERLYGVLAAMVADAVLAADASAGR